MTPIKAAAGIALLAAGPTAILIALAVASARSRRWGRFTACLIGIAAIWIGGPAFLAATASLLNHHA